MFHFKKKRVISQSNENKVPGQVDPHYAVEHRRLHVNLRKITFIKILVITYSQWETLSISFKIRVITLHQFQFICHVLYRLADDLQASGHSLSVSTPDTVDHSGNVLQHK